MIWIPQKKVRNALSGTPNIRSWDDSGWVHGKILMEDIFRLPEQLARNKKISGHFVNSRISSQEWGRLLLQKHGQCFKHNLSKAAVLDLVKKIAYHRENKSFHHLSLIFIYRRIYSTTKRRLIFWIHYEKHQIFFLQPPQDINHSASSHWHKIKGTEHSVTGQWKTAKLPKTCVWRRRQALYSERTL